MLTLKSSDVTTGVCWNVSISRPACSACSSITVCKLITQGLSICPKTISCLCSQPPISQNINQRSEDLTFQWNSNAETQSRRHQNRQQLGKHCVANASVAAVLSIQAHHCNQQDHWQGRLAQNGASLNLEPPLFPTKRATQLLKSREQHGQIELLCDPIQGKCTLLLSCTTSNDMTDNNIVSQVTSSCFISDMTQICTIMKKKFHVTCQFSGLFF